MEYCIIPLKTCTKCNQLKPATLNFFHKHNTGQHGLHPTCKICRNYPAKPAPKNGYKICSKCNEEKPATREYFYNHSAGRGGLCAACIECINAAKRKHPKKIRREDGFKVCTNPECGKVLPATLDYFNYDKSSPDGLCARCKECVNIRNREWRERHPEYSQEWANANKEHIGNYQYEYRLANKERISKVVQEWAKNNPDKRRIHFQRRRARKRSLPDTFTADQWFDCLEYFHYCCAVCGKQLRDLFGDVEPHADHWIALSNPDCPGTVAENMVCLCNDCNLSKHTKSPDAWLKSEYTPRKASEILERINIYFATLKRD